MSETGNKFIKLVSRKIPQIRGLKALLEKGADINFQTTEKAFTALMIAVETQSDRLVEYLLKQGANPLLEDNQNRKASDLTTCDSSIHFILRDYELLFATLNNDMPRVKSLIEAGVYVDFQGIHGYTALMIAVEENLPALVTYFLEQKASLLLTRDDGKTIFEMANDDAMFNLLVTYNNPDNDVLKHLQELKQVTVSQLLNKTFFRKNIEDIPDLNENPRGL